jgi:phosphoglycolate phosphatase-like HAD superfamily hydrolase
MSETRPLSQRTTWSDDGGWTLREGSLQNSIFALESEAAALREQAERAERERDAARLELCSWAAAFGTTRPSTAVVGLHALERDLAAARAEVARLTNALHRILDIPHASDIKAFVRSVEIQSAAASPGDGGGEALRILCDARHEFAVSRDAAAISNLIRAIEHLARLAVAEEERRAKARKALDGDLSKPLTNALLAAIEAMAGE